MTVEPWIYDLIVGLRPLLIMLALDVMLIGRMLKVRDYRLAVLEAIARAQREDLMKGRPYRWRLDEFEKASAIAMLFVFWKPLHKHWATPFFWMTDAEAEEYKRGE